MDIPTDDSLQFLNNREGVQEEEMNKIMKGLAGILAGFMLMGTLAMADTPATILETFTGDTTVSVYVKGIGEDLEASVQIATAEADKVDMQMISELDVPMRTLVMVDNSLSISKENRGKISEFLQNLISDRLNNEEICIAVFSEDIHRLTDYTSDYTALKRAAEGIAYEDQETYLTDVLYDLLVSEYKNNGEDIYRRIVVVSDGVDNKSLGYTKDELYSLLKDVRVPVYTIGSLNGKNNEGLENMFALSRMTSAVDFLLDDTEELLDITEELNKDRNIVKLSITPTEEMLDGSKKTLKITMPDGTALTAEITMPQQIYVKEEAQMPPAADLEENSQTEPAAEPVMEEAPEAKQKPVILMLLIAGLAAAIAAGVILAIKKKKRKPENEGFDETALDRQLHNDDSSGDKTEIIGAFQDADNEGGTVLIWNQEAKYQVVLTDVNSPAKSFQAPLNQSVVIGRKKGECDIALDYEKSVSGKHCEISERNGKFYVRDLQSSNGTWLNGNKVLTETEIVSGNTLMLGRLEVRFEVR